MTISLPNTTPTTPVVAIPPNPPAPELTGLVDRDSAVRALNQLVSLVIGSRIARDTNHLYQEPLERSVKAWKALLAESDRTCDLAITDEQELKRLQTLGRKFESLTSLIVLARLVKESEWE